MPELSRWRRFTAALPMRTALTGVGTVWLLGCIWSFEEQTNFAAAKGFALPWLLPLVIDGLAAAMAGVAYAASLDARPAIPARIATAIAVGASAASNGVWAWERAFADLTTVVVAVAIPIAANLAFEVLLSEMRRQVQRKRGQRAPVAVPYPRVIRIVLSPFSTFVTWRRLVLELTDPRRTLAPAELEALTAAGGPAMPALPAAAADGSTARLEQASRSEPREITAAEPVSEPVTRPEHVIRAERRPEYQPQREPVSGSAPSGSPAGVSPMTVRATGQSRPALVRPAPRPRQPASIRSNGASTNGAGSNGHGRTNGDDRVRRIAELLGRGEELTGDAVGELFGCSPRTGRRLLAQGMAMLGTNGHSAD